MSAIGSIGTLALPQSVSKPFNSCQETVNLLNNTVNYVPKFVKHAPSIAGSLKMRIVKTVLEFVMNALMPAARWRVWLLFNENRSLRPVINRARFSYSMESVALYMTFMDKWRAFLIVGSLKSG